MVEHPTLSGPTSGTAGVAPWAKARSRTLPAAVTAAARAADFETNERRVQRPELIGVLLYMRIIRPGRNDPISRQAVWSLHSAAKASNRARDMERDSRPQSSHNGHSTQCWRCDTGCGTIVQRCPLASAYSCFVS